jgi:hypothetical protein
MFEMENLKKVQLQVFITSRPETPIRLGFRARHETLHEDFVLHSIDQSVVEHDISIFLKLELHRIKEECFDRLAWRSKAEASC